MSDITKKLQMLISLNDPEHGGPYQGAAATECIEAMKAAVIALEGVERVRDGYASQARFADVDPASYFRDFVSRIDKALKP